MKPHALIIPFPSQSHITPLMQLSKMLANTGFKITFVNSENAHHLILQSQAHAGVALPNHLGLDITLVGVPDGFPPAHFGNLAYSKLLIECTETALRQGVEDLIRRLEEEKMPVTCLIAEYMLDWVYDLGLRFGIPTVAFWSTPVAAYALQTHIPNLEEQGVFPFKAPRGEKQLICGIPGVIPLSPCNFPSFLLIGQEKEDDNRQSYFWFQQLMNPIRRMPEASWIIANTIYELEREAIDAMKNNPAAPPICALGPFLPSAFLLENDNNVKNDNRVGTSLLPEADCLDWLSSHEPTSVVYVAFGSLASVSAAQLKELALGLEASQQPFVWAIRPNFVEGEEANISEVLPPGFTDRTKGQGLIVSWAPQPLVLSHPSVGGFLSHCGWNSTIESISMGVPMLAFPRFAEQRLNARYIVDVWKVGVEFVGGEDGLVGREEVERVIRWLMDEEEEGGREIRGRASEWRKVAKEALSPTGSSTIAFQRLVEDLKERANQG